MKHSLRHHTCLLLAALCCLAAGCKRNMSGDVVVENDYFTVSPDSVVQGDFLAYAPSATHIVSNYAPQAATDSVLAYRLAFNGHDNEMRAGLYHYALLQQDTATATAGVAQQRPHATQPAQGGSITLKIDLSAMADSLERQGHWVTATGDTIWSNEFHGVWVAGSMQPLTWDYSSITSSIAAKLIPTGEHGIYTLTLPRPHTQQPTAAQQREWQIAKPNDQFPLFSSQLKLVDAIYNMAIDDVVRNRQGNGNHHSYGNQHYRSQLTYPTLLTLCYLDPQGAKTTLQRMVSNGRLTTNAPGEISYGPWPVVATDLSWAAAAWEVYAVTGDQAWLRWAAAVLDKTIDDIYAPNIDPTTHLLHGGMSHSFSLWQYYPSWMQGKDVWESSSLTTNVLLARTLEILTDMNDELGRDDNWGEQSLLLREAINEKLWNERKSYYSQYIYTAPYPVQSPAIDNLGQALAVLWNIANDDRAEKLIAKTPVTDFGVPTLSPHFDSFASVNLSETVSPILQALWNLAAAKVDNMHALRRGLGALYRTQALLCGNTGACNAYTGHQMGSSLHDLGSATASLAMVFRVYAGMTFLPDGIEFNPKIPVFLKGQKHVTGFKYRNAELDITIEGVGGNIGSFAIDGVETNDNFLPADIEGHHTIHIKMQKVTAGSQEVTFADQLFSLPATPVTMWMGNSAQLLNPQPAIEYRMVNNGRFGHVFTDTTTRAKSPADRLAANAVVGIGRFAASYFSRPTLQVPAGSVYPLGMWASTGTSLVPGQRAQRMVEMHANTQIVLDIDAEQGGYYCLDMRYACGDPAGRCMVRQVTVNGHNQGTLVMPTLGKHEWMRMGYSSMVTVELLRGANEVVIEPLTGSYVGSQPTVIADVVRVMKK